MEKEKRGGSMDNPPKWYGWLLVILIILMLSAMGAIIITGQALAEAEPEEESPWRYELYDTPQIAESEWPAELFCAHIMRVEIDWQAVKEENYLRAILALPYHASQVYDVVLTDGQHWTHADLEQLGESSLRLKFASTALYEYSEGSWVYLVVIAIM